MDSIFTAALSGGLLERLVAITAVIYAIMQILTKLPGIKNVFKSIPGEVLTILVSVVAFAGLILAGQLVMTPANLVITGCAWILSQLAYDKSHDTWQVFKSTYLQPE